MATIESSIDVSVPLTTAYNQWTQFEEFPRFMAGVEEVRQLDDRRLYWKAEMGGQTRVWYARIVEQIPDTRIAWTSEDADVPNAGTVSFHRLDDATTRIMLVMDYEPQRFLERAADMLGLMKVRVRGDLERFKRFIEARGVETGGWRGEIDERRRAG